MVFCFSPECLPGQKIRQLQGTVDSLIAADQTILYDRIKQLAKQIAGILGALGCVISYNSAESKIDAAAVKDTR